MVSSGDSGSGYAPTRCGPGDEHVGVAITQGTVKRTVKISAAGCCNEGAGAPGWTWTPPPKAANADELALLTPGDYTFDKEQFHVTVTEVPGIKDTDTWQISGSVTAAAGGTVAVHYQNGTQADGAIKFDPFTVKAGSSFYRANATQVLGGTTYYGHAQFEKLSTGMVCGNFEFFKDEAHHSLAFLLEHGGNPPPPPPPGTCEIYSAVTAHGPSADPNVVSGGSAISPTKPPVLWPSWPASSPWVTAVGATRYTEQKIGNPEMATDQFGSGGGFSLQFGQSPDATYQSAAVANYLATVDKDTLPPAGSFPPMGRATPDVSALGEGYQVIVRGKAESVGGTSASSPAFAGMVSLLNEARLAKGGKQMGFLNPFLYKNAAAFTSIDLGSNKVGRQMQPLPFGFNCSKGWDPATGLGTPQFQKLLAAATAGN